MPHRKSTFKAKRTVCTKAMKQDRTRRVKYIKFYKLVKEG